MNNNVLTDEKTYIRLNFMSDEEKTNYFIQRLVDDYLREQNLPSVDEQLQKKGEKEEPGVITELHTRYLQCLIKDYFTATGKKIEAEAAARNITLKEGVLSELEQETLDTLLADYCKTIQKMYENK